MWTAVRPSSGTGDGTPVRKCLQLSVGYEEKLGKTYKTIQDKKGQDKTETIEKKRKPADVPAAVVAATIGMAEVSGIANAPIAAFAVPAAPSSGRRKGYFRYVRMRVGRHWWTKYKPTVSG